jgi:predicted metal-dependent HD superfamily phosphohydrolase
MREAGGAAAPFTPAGFAIPAVLWEQVKGAYAEAGRAYHDVRHLAEVLARYDEVARDVGWEHPREVYLALLFHDAVYVPGAHDNEERSAERARDVVARWLPGAGVDVERVAHLVRLTARHGRLSVADVTAEEALFLDCDMAILGSAPGRYDAYEADVAREYAALPPALYAAGRRQFLEGLLARQRIFLSDFFRARLEQPARENLRRTLGA